MTSARKQLIRDAEFRDAFAKLANLHGIKCDYQGSITDPKTAKVTQFKVTLNAPHGFVFVSSGTHCDRSIRSEENTMSLDWSKAYVMLENIIAAGLVASNG